MKLLRNTLTIAFLAILCILPCFAQRTSEDQLRNDLRQMSDTRQFLRFLFGAEDKLPFRSSHDLFVLIVANPESSRVVLYSNDLGLDEKISKDLQNALKGSVFENTKINISHDNYTIASARYKQKHFGGHHLALDIPISVILASLKRNGYTLHPLMVCRPLTQISPSIPIYKSGRYTRWYNANSLEAAGNIHVSTSVDLNILFGYAICILATIFASFYITIATIYNIRRYDLKGFIFKFAIIFSFFIPMLVCLIGFIHYTHETEFIDRLIVISSIWYGKVYHYKAGLATLISILFYAIAWAALLISNLLRFNAHSTNSKFVSMKQQKQRRRPLWVILFMTNFVILLGNRPMMRHGGFDDSFYTYMSLCMYLIIILYFYGCRRWLYKSRMYLLGDLELENVLNTVANELHVPNLRIFIDQGKDGKAQAYTAYRGNDIAISLYLMKNFEREEIKYLIISMLKSRSLNRPKLTLLPLIILAVCIITIPCVMMNYMSVFTARVVVYLCLIALILLSPRYVIMQTESWIYHLADADAYALSYIENPDTALSALTKLASQKPGYEGILQGPVNDLEMINHRQKHLKELIGEIELPAVYV